VLLEVLRGQRPGGVTGLAADTARNGHPTANGRGTSNDIGGRISAEAIVSAADSLPVGEILRAVLPQEAELLRLLLLVPEIQVRILDLIGPDQLPNTIARELFRAVLLAREPNDAGIRPAFSLAALVESLDPETAALAQATLARTGPNPRELSENDLVYEVERLIIDLEERALDERSLYVQDALAEAEQAVREGGVVSATEGATEGGATARASVDQLLRESQAINDQRRSLHRRREQAHLLSRPVAVRA
jgi:hypothetical protein